MDFSSFKLDNRLVEILATHGINTPTEIQAKTFSLAANGYDVIGISQTGSGKTLAFLLPMLSQILASNKPFHTLIVVPTREIAKQISDSLAIFASVDVRVALLLGGEPINPQAVALSKKPHIVVGTPGRIVKHIEKTKNFKIDFIRKLILDEADRFFEYDFLDELNTLAERLTRKRQTLMFTATLTDKTAKLAHLFMKSPRTIQVSEKYSPCSTLDEYFTLIPECCQLATLINQLKTDSGRSVIIFVAMCATAQKINLLLNRFEISSEFLHGSLQQPDREAAISRFASGKFSILVSTDLASRGLDISHVDLIINYDLPNTAREYTHRVGRTARAGRAGTAISFVNQYTVGKYQRLEYALGRKLNELRMDCDDHFKEINKVYQEICSEVNEKIGNKKRRK